MNLHAYLTSVIRTIVPAAWGTALAWLVSVGILDQAAAAGPGAAAGGFLVTVAIGLYYLLARLVEPHLPPFLAAILLGSPAAPTYQGTVPVGGTAVDRGEHEA